MGAAPMGEAGRRALALLHRCRGPDGFVAAPGDVANYHRVWARDGVICGLAGALAGDAALLDGLAATLATLRAGQGPHGEIPSNVDASGAASYGTLAGRVDAPLWYVLGVAALAARRPGEAAGHREAVVAALRLVEAWELNDRGLVYAPAGGTWADEMPQHGYLLGVQALRVWALRAAGRAFGERSWSERADRVAALVARDYRLGGDPAGRYHPRAYAAARDPGHWVAGFSPGGYDTRFDGFANALALLAGLGGAADVAGVAERLAGELGTWLTPAFWPPLRPGEHGWDELRACAGPELRNRPGEYHNGGLWPVVSGFLAAALAAGGREAAAERVADAIDEANAAGGWGFFECHHAFERRPLGVRETAWSAAGAIIARAALAGRPLPAATGL